MEGPQVHASNVIKEREIPYRPRFTKLTGKVTAAVLLQQMIYYWDISKGRPFYKFRAPCKHDRYVEDDSWIECLGFSPAEFDTALRTIGTKITKGDSRTDALGGGEVCNLVLYWTDSNRMTWYELNMPLLNRMLNDLYSEANSRKCNYQDDTESESSIELQNQELHSSQRPHITHIPPPKKQEAAPPTAKANIHRLLQATKTQGEDETPKSALAEYIGQKIDPVPPGQRNDLARPYTEHLPGGKKLKHPSPDELWLKHPLFPDWVEERIKWAVGKGGSNAAQRKRAVSAVCKYKGNEWAWLEWLARRESHGPAGFKPVEEPSEEDLRAWEEGE